jgi:hypothetical protein
VIEIQTKNLKIDKDTQIYVKLMGLYRPDFGEELECSYEFIGRRF